jgi:phage gp29-like protein
MARKVEILDQFGRPIDRAALVQEREGATVTGVRSPLTGYPGDGLDPMRLAAILREADQGDPVRYLELAETVEERDPHYLGVLGTRKRAVSQLEITVEAASDSAEHQAHAEPIRSWLKRDELQGELFDMLDAIGKAYSFTRIQWDTSEGQWQPRQLDRWDPRWFRFERHNLEKPVMLDENGAEVPLPPGEFIYAVMRAKSGLALRSGIARVALWAWMFKAFTQRDWAIFTQNHGQPIRIGKYGPGATQADKDTLYRAVANIAGDCAALVPDGMIIEFVESKSIGASSDLYEKRSDWLDKQLSKLVLGQTATTDAVTGGLGSGKEHRQVQEDIERADAKALSAIINRDLIRLWIDLEFGPQKAYPRVKIGRAEETDVKLTVDSVTRLVPLGLEVGKNQMREIVGIGKPADDDELLAAPVAAAPEEQEEDEAPKPKPKDEKQRRTLHQVEKLLPDELIAEAALDAAAPAIGALVEKVRGIVARAGSLEAAEDVLARTAAAQRTPPELVAAMRQAMLLAWLAGEAAEADLGD